MEVYYRGERMPFTELLETKPKAPQVVPPPARVQVVRKSSQSGRRSRASLHTRGKQTVLRLRNQDLRLPHGTCGLCREVFCASCLSFHQAEHLKPPAAVPTKGKKRRTA